LNRHEIDLAGDVPTMPEAAEILTEALGRLIAFAQTPIEQVRQYSKDTALVLRWFERVGYSADLAGLDASSAARSRSSPTGHAATRDQMGAETRESMVDLTSHGVSFALLQGQLPAGEISRSAFLDRGSPLGAGTCEAAAIADKVLAIAASQAARQKDLKSSYDYSVVRSGASGFSGCATADYANDHPIGFATGTCTGACCR
jgi:hypothetical protein